MVVSIPFKREGLSELNLLASPDAPPMVSIPFKREGLSELAYPVVLVAGSIIVSIPFKREGLSEPHTTKEIL